MLFILYASRVYIKKLTPIPCNLRRKKPTGRKSDHCLPYPRTFCLIHALISMPSPEALAPFSNLTESKRHYDTNIRNPAIDEINNNSRARGEREKKKKKAFFQPEV